MINVYLLLDRYEHEAFGAPFIFPPVPDLSTRSGEKKKNIHDFLWIQ